MSEVTIKFNFDTSGVRSVDDMIDKLGELDRAQAQSASSSGGSGNFISGLAGMVGGVQGVIGALKSAGGLIDSVNEVGVASLRSKAALDAWSGGKADEYISRMAAATKGLVDDTELMAVATKGLSTGAVQTAEDLERLARNGATLGLTFNLTAEGGVKKLEAALESVGNIRSLRALGLDADDVKKHFGELQATMSREDAWRLAVMDEADEKARKFAGALDGTGTALERFKISAADAWESFAEKAATGLDYTLRLIDALGQLNAIEQGRIQYQLTTKANYAVAEAPKEPDRVKEWASNMTSAHAAQGWLQLGMTPEEYFAALSGYQYGDNARYGSPNLNYANAGGMVPGTGGYPFQTGFNNPQFLGSTSFFYGSQRTDQQDYLVRHPDMRYMPSYAQDDPRNNYLARRDAQANDQAVAMEAFRNILHKTHDTFLDVEIAAKGIIKPFQDASDAYAKDAQRRANIQSVSDAFGLKKDGFYSEMGQGLAGGLQARRDQLETDLEKRYGKGSKKVQQGLDQYDQQAKIAMDQYNLATGQATRESIYFRDAQDGLLERFRTGKISMQEYTAQILAMSAAAKDGKVDINSLIDLNYAPQIKAAGRKAGNIRWQANDEKNNAAMEGKDGQIKDNVLTAMKKEANEAETAINAANTAVGNVVTGLTAKIPDAVKALEPFGGAVSGILAELTTLANMSFNVQITTTQTKIGGGGPGKGKTKGPGQIGYFN